MVKNKKQKGSHAERELIHAFWKMEWAAVRVAGSGSMKYPSPDIVASNALRRLAIECKAVGEDKKYLTQREIEQLSVFAQKFGAEPWLAVRFDNENWYFFSLDDLRSTKGNNYALDLLLAKQKGLLFEEVIGIFKQEKLTLDKNI